MAKGLEWYIQEADKQEEKYQYHNLMTLMEQEFSIDLWHYKEWKEVNQEIAKIYEKISNLRDEKYF